MSRPPLWASLSLLWIAGASLRMTILAVPPLLPTIHRSLHLSEAEVGALTTLPVLLLAAAALLGSLLVARLGARRALISGLTLVTLGGAARGIGSSAVLLFVMTFVMGVGVAVSQPTFPALVRYWVPTLSGTATAIYSNGFLIGEIAAVSLTVPVVLPLMTGRWQFTLAAWSVPVALATIAMTVGTAHINREAGLPPVRWWPDWRNQQTWRLGLLLGCASVAYFGSNVFIPDYLKSTHSATSITLALTSLNLGQLPASLLIAVMPSRFVTRRFPLFAAGLIIFIASLGLFLPGGWFVLSAGIMGFGTATIFVLSLALPPVLAREDTVHRLSAAMFAIGYTCSFGSTLVGGALWDVTGVPATTFSPILLAGPLAVLLIWKLSLQPQSL